MNKAIFENLPMKNITAYGRYAVIPTGPDSGSFLRMHNQSGGTAGKGSCGWIITKSPEKGLSRLRCFCHSTIVLILQRIT